MNALRPLLFGTLIAIAVAGPGWFWTGGILEQETIAFMDVYTADRPVLNRVFDPHANDFGTYQARELSYFIDLIDTRFYVHLARTCDLTLFVPLSAAVASLLLVAVLLTATRRTMPRLDTVVVALLGACLVTSFPFVSTMGVFYRSGKPLLAVVVLAALFHMRHVHQRRTANPEQRWARDAAILAALCLCGGLLDRQGFVYVLLAAGVLGIHYGRTRQLGDLCAAATLSAAGLVLYNVALAPAVIHHLNGYWPDFHYQVTAFPGSYSAIDPRPFWSALELLAANVGELLGGVRSGVVVLAAALGAMVYVRPRGWPFGYAMLAFAGQVVMFSLMIRRHPEVSASIDHRFWYYPLPFLVTVLFALALGLDTALSRWPAGRRFIIAALAAIVTANLAGLNGDREMMKAGAWFGPVHEQSELLKSSLRTGAPDARLVEDYRWFFEFDRRWRSPPPDPARPRP